MRKTLLLVFIHGFKGSDDTFGQFPKDIRALVSNALPDIDILSVQYPRYETRGDLRECVARFKEWLQNKVIDLEVANRTPSPTVDPSVRVILIGHSMGGIVATETLLSIARDEPVRPGAGNNSTATSRPQTPRPAGESESQDNGERASSAPLEGHNSALFFPYIQAVLAFDTPFLGISPGVLAHGAEEHLNNASTAYKAFNGASQLFGWNSPSQSPQPVANASSRGLPAPEASSSGSGWGKWGKYAMVGGAAAAVAGAAGAAYLNWNQINQGLAWAGSHLEFVGCLARGAELQKRVESVISLTESHGVGFADFYTVLGEKVSKKTQYAGQLLGQDRTFCVIPKDAHSLTASPTGSKRPAPAPGAAQSPHKRRKTLSEEDMQQEMKDGEKVQQFAQDTSKKKGDWVRCRNDIAKDELKAHTSMFAPGRNPGYYNMLPMARDRIVGWVDKEWYGEAGENEEDGENAADSVGADEEGEMPA